MKYLALAALLTLGACGFTPGGDLFRDTVSQKGAQAYDEGLVNAEWFVCNAASVGSIKRRYFGSTSSAATYNEFCNSSGSLEVDVE